MATAPDTAAELLEIILESGIPRICKAYRKPPLPTRLLRDLYAIEDRPEARRFIAAYPLSPSDLLEALSRECADPETLAAAALNPRTPAHLLSRLIESASSAVRAEVAINSQLSPRDMRLLARDIDASVRSTVAKNPALKPQLMAELSNDGRPAVRASLAANPSLFPEIRFARQADPSPIVGSELVAHCEDEETLLFWADSDDENLQIALLERKSLPDSVGHSLLFSPHPAIRAEARERFAPTFPERLGIARRGTIEERQWLAAQPEMPLALQRILSQDESADVRRRLAAHPDVHADVAAHFITMHDEDCCEALAANPATPKDLLLALARSGIDSIPSLLAYRNDLSVDLLEYLLLEAPSEAFVRHLAIAGNEPPALSGVLLTSYARHPLPSVRAFVATRAELDLSQRSRLGRDIAPPVREAICRNPATTDLELEELLDDSDPAVAQTARKRWQSNRRTRRTPAPESTSPGSDAEAGEASEVSLESNFENASGVLRRIKRIFV